VVTTNWSAKGDARWQKSGVSVGVSFWWEHEKPQTACSFQRTWPSLIVYSEDQKQHKRYEDCGYNGENA